MRKLASIRKIIDISPIEKADLIELAQVDGWRVVVKKGEYKVGDLAVYLEVDSWVPHELAPFLSRGQEPREYNGIKGERLRTVRLRGQLSQGLLLPVNIGIGGFTWIRDINNETVLVNEGDDVTDHLGIQKWEAPIPVQLTGQIRGNFPSIIPKTDQERAQNLVAEIAAAYNQDMYFEITEKIEGSSCTFYLDLENEFHVCSRNLDLKRDNNNSFWRAAIKNNVENRMLIANMEGYAIQGELVGPSIQGNIYGFSDVEFFVFDIYNAKKGRYLTPLERQETINQLGLNHVPILNWNVNLVTADIEYLLSMADGRSQLGKCPMREGLVFKAMNGGMTFKVISNSYLLGER
jgi:RNA ligase (TIGR02306 family)